MGSTPPHTGATIINLQNNISIIPLRHISTPEELENFIINNMTYIYPVNILSYNIPPPPPPSEPHPNDSFWQPVSIRMTVEEFDTQIETCNMTKTIREKYNTHNSVCIICQDDINLKQKCSILKCGHIYHTKCIKTWLVETCEKPTCPCCREDVRHKYNL